MDAPRNKLNYKMFWTWDHSTNWVLNNLGTQNCGVANNYTKKPASFLQDYMRAVDWCAANGMDAIGIVGMLRDCHGGFDSARRLCAYALEHGVRIYLIAGLYAYGGIYYEGDSKYSLDRFLAKNPDCMGQDVDLTPQYIQFRYPYGYKREPSACPANPKVRSFVLDCLDFLFTAIPELGGIQMETGDSAICLCEKCRERRQLMRGGEKRIPTFSFSDMADIYPEAADVIWSRSPDAWVICETYNHYTCNSAFFDAESPAMEKMLKMPDKTFWQWGDRQFRNSKWPENAPLPEHLRRFRHIQRAHHGTQWGGGRNTIAVDEIRKQCLLSLQSGFQGVSIFGETSPFHTNAECNYLALQFFSDHPQASLHDFAADALAQRMGGTDLADTYLQLAYLSKEPDKIPAALPQIAKIIASATDYDTTRRWTWLASFLNSFYWESIHNK